MNTALISVEKAAKRLKLDPSSVRRYCRLRRLKTARKFGRDWWLDPAEVAEFQPNRAGNPNFQK